jgi:hypothetical protein
VQGYAKRFGASYGDYFIGNFLGNAVLTTTRGHRPRSWLAGYGFVRGAHSDMRPYRDPY